MTSGLLNIPANFFGIVLGLTGLGACWRVASRVWLLPSGIGEAITDLAAAVFIVLATLYAAKLIWNWEKAVEEFEHPIQCCFVGLVPAAAMLVAMSIMPHAYVLGLTVGVGGAVVQLLFAVYRTGILWTGARDHAATTPILYHPTVAGNLVTSSVASALHQPDLAAMFFGAGMLSWFALESVLLHRFYTQAPLDVALRPTMGIQIAPAFVACSAYLSLTTGAPDLVAKSLFGYGLLQMAIVARLLAWIWKQPFVAGYWAFSFGLTAASYDGLKFVERGALGIFPMIATTLFVAMNGAMLLIIVRTLVLAAGGRLLPNAPSPSKIAPPATRLLVQRKVANRQISER